MKPMCLIICVFLLLTSCEYFDYNYEDETEAEAEEIYETGNENTPLAAHERRLACKHTNLEEFYHSVQNPKEFTLNGDVAGGIAPHHMVAASLVSGFFKAVAGSGKQYDTVVVVAPNHAGGTTDIITSFKDWQTWDTVYCDRDIVTGMYGRNFDGFDITENDDRMEEEHSVSVLIPYINHYLPETKVSAFLVTSRLTLEDTYNFMRILSGEIKTSGKSVLFIASIDFSHYLPASVAVENDRTTEAAIMNRNYREIHGFSDEYVDSPQSLNIFLMYLESIGINADGVEILYNTNASEFTVNGINETTSYFVIAAYES